MEGRKGLRHEWVGSLVDSCGFFEVIDSRADAGTGEDVGVVRAVEIDLREPNESQDEAKEEELVELIVSVGEETDDDDDMKEEMVAMHAWQEFPLVRRRMRTPSD